MWRTTATAAVTASAPLKRARWPIAAAALTPARADGWRSSAIVPAPPWTMSTGFIGVSVFKVRWM